MAEQQQTEKELRVILNKNIFMAYIKATLELAENVEGSFNQREKYVYNRAMKQLNKILATFEHYSDLSPLHVAQVDALMEYAQTLSDHQMNILKEDSGDKK